ncbi:pyridoxamine 5'-phosphate oxidase family protein [Brevundimonas sp.]|uniref:pyridoxamine 5'-phosphate oxidase family protein n=1 Tax=Brevundimonas sp. TaxID=1871086 RepID=UPI002D4FDEBD|nr:pyridoxamine 5'-phosphate oxidase family protein [Brevundimonas sp.]HYD27688.1 pyridoxamine 5'-phosphate oxidase family protein [Brevundimonas sp.]
MSAPAPIHGRAVDAIVELLERERLMTIACNRPDGWPQATTVGYLNEGLNLYFIVARTSQKYANLSADPRASVAIRSESGGHGGGVGVSMAGRVAEVVDPEAVGRLNRRIGERYPEVHIYSPSGDSVAVLHFRPTIISAVGVTRGRSEAETFTVGESGDESVSRLF